MKAEEIIDKIIFHHENKNPKSIRIHDNLHLEPMLNYSGKMARNAYLDYGYKWNQNRRFCGILDFRIMDETGKMEHGELLARSLGLVSLDIMRDVYDGKDPFKMNLTEKQLSVVCDIQASMIEQEVNWGTNEFQKKTHLGDPEKRTDYIRNAVPRDFFMLFFERCIALRDAGEDISEIVEETLDSNYEESYVARKKVLKLPKSSSGKYLKLQSEYLPYLRSNNLERVELWITPFVDRIEKLCIKIGENPYWNKTYNK